MTNNAPRPARTTNRILVSQYIFSSAVRGERSLQLVGECLSHRRDIFIILLGAKVDMRAGTTLDFLWCNPHLPIIAETEMACGRVVER